MYRELINRTEEYVKAYLSGVESGHNWWHIYRVRNIALHIFSIEKKGDPFIIEMGSLLHDIGDYKIKSVGDDHDIRGFLEGLRLKKSQIDKILYIIDHISFKRSFGSEYEHMPELDIVQDADRLDALGAIGIARAFNYGGYRGLEIYKPGIQPSNYKTSAEYKVSGSSTINHFYEKLLKLKDMMNTTTGRKLADERHTYMEGFLKQFFMEWNKGISSHGGADF
ncbi:MAG: HD domain-containing protein [Bacteroidota bacterium]|nr:HD domain-containing protein [Bacteroidota bacterium]